MLSTLLFILVITFVSYLISFKWKERRLIRMVNQFNGPPTLPIVGNALPFATKSTKDMLAYSLQLMRTYKNPLRLWLFHIPYVAITDPEDFQIVSTKVLEKDPRMRFLADLIGDGLITAKVEKWKKNRKVVYPIFNRTILYSHYLEIFNKQNRRLMQALKKEANTDKHFDAWLHIFKAFFNIISETAMGYNEDFQSQETLTKLKENTAKASILAGKRFYQPWLQPALIFKLYMYLKGCGNVFEESKQIPLEILRIKRQNYLKKKRLQQEALVKEEKSYKNFIDILLHTHEENQFTDKDMADEVLTIMFAATETSALTSCFTLLMLAIRQDIQDLVYKEVHDTFGDSDRSITPDDLNKLQFLEQCVKETLRLFAPVPIVLRHTSEDLELTNGNVIPAGANIVLAILGIHLDPKLYPDPTTWNPYNFDEDKVAARHPASFVPFGVGPRMCIGYKQSIVAIKTQLSMILRNFKITTEETGYEMDVDFLIRSARGFNIKLHYRHDSSLF